VLNATVDATTAVAASQHMLACEACAQLGSGFVDFNVLGFGHDFTMCVEYIYIWARGGDVVVTTTAVTRHA
jgi:hypothetical protein